MLNPEKFLYFSTNTVPLAISLYIFFCLRWLDHVDNAISNKQCYSNELLWAAYHINKAETTM